MNKIVEFKNRERKAKETFNLLEIEKNVAYEFIRRYHYLGDAKFFAKYSFGIFVDDELVGCATFSNPQGISSLKGWFGLTNDDQSVLELSRLCILPTLNGTNATSYLLGGSIRQLKHKDVRAVITLADDSRHVGSIYQVCNFTYYGLTDKKTDFFRYDGKVNPRGATKSIKGVWIARNRKHRYAYIIDKSLKCNYTEQQRPSKSHGNNYNCCDGSGIVYDKRFDEYYCCPKCSSTPMVKVNA